ncbi:MAG: WD40 repeat domain-containing protein [Prochloraceae cyanobacterium]
MTTYLIWNSAYLPLLNFTKHKDGVNSVAFSPDGKTLATASRDKTVILANFAIDDLLVRGCKRVENYPQAEK